MQEDKGGATFPDLDPFTAPFEEEEQSSRRGTITSGTERKGREGEHTARNASPASSGAPVAYTSARTHAYPLVRAHTRAPLVTTPVEIHMWKPLVDALVRPTCARLHLCLHNA